MRKPSINNHIIEYAGWLDKDTFIVRCAPTKDKEGDTRYLEVEWHKDEKEYTYTWCYKYEFVPARLPLAEQSAFIGFIQGVIKK